MSIKVFCDIADLKKIKRFNNVNFVLSAKTSNEIGFLLQTLSICFE